MVRTYIFASETSTKYLQTFISAFYLSVSDLYKLTAFMIPRYFSILFRSPNKRKHFAKEHKHNYYSLQYLILHNYKNRKHNKYLIVSLLVNVRSLTFIRGTVLAVTNSPLHMFNLIYLYLCILPLIFMATKYRQFGN